VLTNGGQEIINLPRGKWKIFVNGDEGDLNIDSVDKGFLKGTVFGSEIHGGYNDVSGNIFFSRLRPEDIFPPWTEVYYGHTSAAAKHTVDKPSVFMAGFYFTYPPREKRPHGWYATY
jgi:hypothetical protein